MLGNEIWKFCQGAEVAFGTFFFTMHRSVYGLGAIDPRCEIHVRTHSPVDVGTTKNLDVTKFRARKIPGVSFSEGPFSLRSFREGFCVSEKFSR